MRSLGELALVPQQGTSEAAVMECANGAGAAACAEANRPKESGFREQILQLAAIACHEDEEKSRIELLEKLKGCKKLMLVELCCSFDIPGSTSTRKDDLVTIVMEFLMEHCSHLDCTDPDKKFRKRKRRSYGANLSGGDPSKKRKPDGTVSKTHVEDEADGKKGAKDRTNFSEFDLRDNRNVCTDNKTGQFSNGQAKPEPSEGVNDSMPEQLAVVPLPGVPILTHEQILVTTPCAELVSNVENNSMDMKASSTKKNISVTKKKATHKTDLKEKYCGKNVSRGDVKPPKQAVKPTKDELRQAIFCILNTANFATMTFGEVVKAVDRYFGKDLFERKPLIRALIEEELFKLAEEAEKKELEEEEAMEAKARAEQAAKESAKDGIVESDREKENELQACQDGRSKDVKKSDKSNGIEKGAKSVTPVIGGDNKNSDAAAESSQDSEAAVDTKNERNSDGFTKDGEAGNIVRNANGNDVEIFKDGKAEAAKNCNGNAIGGSEDVKAAEHEGTKDGSTEDCRTGNDGNTTKKGGVSEPEDSKTSEKGEHVRCSEDGKSQEAGDDGSGENTLSCGAECGKASETIEDVITEQIGTKVRGDCKAEDGEQNVKTKVDVDSSNHGSADNGRTMDDANGDGHA